MPIANCLVRHRKITPEEIQKLAEEWALEIGVDAKDVCLTFIPNVIQGGQQYEALVNLYLPSLWSDADIRHIQTSLSTLLTKFLNTERSAVFIITSIVQSGHVIENGDVVDWTS
jgi:hypothetical protein